MRNEKEKWEWKMRMRIKFWINKKFFFLMSCQINIWIITGLIDKKSCKKQKNAKEKCAEYYKLNKEAIKEKSRECYKNLIKKTRLKSIKKISRISS